MLMPKFKILLLCSYGFVINTYQKHMTLKRVTCPNMDKSEIHAARAGKCTSYVTSHPNKDIFKQEKKPKKPTSEPALKRFNVTSFCTYAMIDTIFFVKQSALLLHLFHDLQTFLIGRLWAPAFAAY